MTSPYLLEGDKLSLSSEFLLKNNELIDIPLSAHHQLSDRAVPAVAQLKEAMTLGTWREGGGLSTSEQAELLGFVNHVGALKLQRSLPGSFQAFVHKLAWATQGIKLVTVTYRRPASFGYVATATLRATGWLWVSWPVLLALIASTGAFNEAKFALITGGTLLAITFSVIVHEFTHVYIAALAGEDSSVIQNGLRLGVLHRRLSNKHELLSASLSPVIGALFGFVLGLCASRWIDPIFSVYGILIGSLHLASWLPWYGDGLTLLKLSRGN